MKKNECTVGHLPLGKTGNFSKSVFYFLSADQYSICEVEITGTLVNLGDRHQLHICKFLVN